MKPAELADILGAFERRHNAYAKHIVLSPAKFRAFRLEFVNNSDTGFTYVTDRVLLRAGLQARVWDQEIWTLAKDGRAVHLDDHIRLSAETRPENDPKWVPSKLVDTSGWDLAQ